MKLIFAMLVGSSVGCNFAGKSASSVRSDDPSETAVSTIISCEQDDGDQWKSVGIAMNDGQCLTAFLVQNDADTNSNLLLQRQRVKKFVEGGQTIYRDEADSFKLIVKKAKRPKKLVGSLFVLADGWHLIVRQLVSSFN